jgi:hypothetical protein
MYNPTDRFENWFITSLQTDVNDTTTSFRLNKALNVNQCRLVIDPYDESKREIVKVTSVDGNLVYVERGDDNTAPEYHNEGTIVALHVFAADLNDLYADWAEVQVDMQQQQTDFENAQTNRQNNFEISIQNQFNVFEGEVNDQIANVQNLAFLAAHPVGSIFFTTIAANPGTLFGGTWVAWGSGRMPIGVDSSNTKIDTPGETGGSFDHRHGAGLIGASGTENYGTGTGDMRAAIGAQASDANRIGYVAAGVDMPNGGNRPSGTYSGTWNNASSGRTDWNHFTPVYGYTNANNPPYIAVYMWKRTA